MSQVEVIPDTKGIKPRVIDFINQYYGMGNLVEAALEARMSHEVFMDQIEGSMRDCVAGEFDQAIYNFVREWKTNGTIKDLRLKMFGLYGDRGYWHEPKTQARIQQKPDTYAEIVAQMLQGYIEKSEAGNQFSVDVFESLIKTYYDVGRVGPSLEIWRDVSNRMVDTAKKVGERHPSIRAKLVATGIELTSLADFTSLPDLERDELVGNLIKALIVPKTPQKRGV